MKKLFIETLQQDARNIFYVADFLFRSNSRLCFFDGIFYLRLIFQFSRQICMLKSYNDKKTYLTLIFLHQGWLPLSKVINITLYSWFCCLYCQRKVNILSIFRKSKKIVTEPYLRLALYLEKKKKMKFTKKTLWYWLSIRWKSPKGYKSQFHPLKLVFWSLRHSKMRIFQVFWPKMTNISKNTAPMIGKPTWFW